MIYSPKSRECQINQGIRGTTADLRLWLGLFAGLVALAQRVAALHVVLRGPRLENRAANAAKKAKRAPLLLRFVTVQNLSKLCRRTKLFCKFSLRKRKRVLTKFPSNTGRDPEGNFNERKNVVLLRSDRYLVSEHLDVVGAERFPERLETERRDGAPTLGVRLRWGGGRRRARVSAQRRRRRRVLAALRLVPTPLVLRFERAIQIAESRVRSFTELYLRCFVETSSQTKRLAETLGEYAVLFRRFEFSSIEPVEPTSRSLVQKKQNCTGCNGN